MTTQMREFTRLEDLLGEMWQPRPQEYERLAVHNRTARSEPGRNTDIFMALLARDGGRCWMCGATRKQLVIEHLRPRSSFYEDQVSIADRSDNLALACWDCNEEKSNRDVPFDPPLPIVWICHAWAGDASDSVEVFCAEHRHICRVPAGARFAGLRPPTEKRNPTR